MPLDGVRIDAPVLKNGVTPLGIPSHGVFQINSTQLGVRAGEYDSDSEECCGLCGLCGS